jgi:MoxR-like ATPase
MTTQTDDRLGTTYRAPKNPAYDQLGLDLGDRRDGQVYVHDAPLRLAVRVAIATARPLLLRGVAGSGKSSLAPFVARMHERRFYKATVTARTEARDLMWTFDALQRLNDAQVTEKPTGRNAASGNVRRVDVLENYITPRALWWAFDPQSAARRGAAKSGVDPVTDPGIGPRKNGVVVLIDEIDKADPDVPNNLLESLGSLQFTVVETGKEVKLADPRQVPLVIITTNDERELPAAFYRRCVVHVLPEHGKDRLVEIAGAHFDAEVKDRKKAKALYADVAVELQKYRDEAKKLHTRRPSTAEYLDAVRACITLKIDTRHKDWSDVARLTLTKPAPDPSA